MLVLAWVLSLVAVFLLGLYLNKLSFHVKTLREAVKKKVDVKEEPTPEKSALYDPYLEAAKVNRDHETMMERLNPDA
jgi:hypothetical protein